MRFSRYGRGSLPVLESAEPSRNTRNDRCDLGKTQPRNRRIVQQSKKGSQRVTGNKHVSQSYIVEIQRVIVHPHRFVFLRLPVAAAWPESRRKEGGSLPAQDWSARDSRLVHRRSRVPSNREASGASNRREINLASSLNGKIGSNSWRQTRLSQIIRAGLQTSARAATAGS
jgi:hypothetical protein